MRRLCKWSVLAALALGCWLTPSTAQAWVRTTTLDNGNPIGWTRSCVFMTPSTERAGGLNATEILTAIHGAADAWSNVGCSYIQIVMGSPEPGLEAGFDQDVQPENVIVFQDSTLR